MTIAYFILVHHKPDQFRRLIEAIYHPEDLFLIHVDLKSRLGLKRDRRGVMAGVEAAMAGRPNLRLMRSRFTNWGGWSLSAVALAAIDQLLAWGQDWHHVVTLSGLCYPLKSRAAMLAALTAAGDRQWVEMRPFASLPADDWHLRAWPMIELPVKAVRLPLRRPPPGDFAFGHKGSQWVMLSRDFCRWQQTAAVARRIRAWLRHSFLSDELIFQTLLANSPCPATADDGREILWPGPRLLTSADLPRLLASPALFARKLDAAVDAAVLDALDAARTAPAPAVPVCA